MNKYLRPILFLLPLLAAPMAQAANDAQLASIARMGELNGVALQCRLMPQMQKIKQSLVLNLPKRRELGLWFEEKTNESFMTFMQKQQACPDASMFSKELDLAISKLEKAFQQ